MSLEYALLESAANNKMPDARAHAESLMPDQSLTPATAFFGSRAKPGQRAPVSSY